MKANMQEKPQSTMIAYLLLRVRLMTTTMGKTMSLKSRVKKQNKKLDDAL
jgi:hypothetical protein